MTIIGTIILEIIIFHFMSTLSMCNQIATVIGVKIIKGTTTHGDPSTIILIVFLTPGDIDPDDYNNHYHFVCESAMLTLSPTSVPTASTGVSASL